MRRNALKLTGLAAAIALASGCDSQPVSQDAKTRTSSQAVATDAQVARDASNLLDIDPVLPNASRDDWQAAGVRALERRLAIPTRESEARNVILFIGDGMGPSTVTAMRILAGQRAGNPGEETVLSFEQMPYAAMVKTYNTNAQVADSAGTASAMMTGTKTSIGVINMPPEHTPGICAGAADSGLDSLAMMSERAGKATGVVTTTRLTHATPATVYANSASRNWESDGDLPDEAIEAGCQDIAAQFLDFPGNGLDVALGGGRSNFLPETMQDPEYPDRIGRRQDGRDLTRDWLKGRANAAYVSDLEGFNAVDPASTDQLLGLFEPSHMNYESQRGDDGAGEPSLADMTIKALDILDRDPDGYFLMVEGGRIDHAHHGGNAYTALTDGIAFDEAVATALNKVDLSETLVIVTADHSHVFTISGYPPRGNDILGLVREVGEHGKAEEDPRLAEDGHPFTTLGYWNGPGAIDGARARPDNTDDPGYRQQAAIPLRSETHAGEDVAAYAAGPWGHLVSGSMEQHVLYHIMRHAMGASVGASQEEAGAP